jgi:hypothetical protein
MFESILNFIRDVVVIGYMFVLRIGVPIIVTLFMGWWLERKLAEWDAKDIAALQAQKEKEQRRAEEVLRSH